VMEKLSVRQQQVLDFISWYFAENGFCPSLTDIAQGLNLHDSTIATYVNILKKKGRVVSEYRTARSLRVVPEKVTEKVEAMPSTNPQQDEAHTAPSVERRERRHLLKV